MKQDGPPSSAASTEAPAHLQSGLLGVWVAFWLITGAVDFQEYVRGGGSQFWRPLVDTSTSALAATSVAAVQLRRAGAQLHLLQTPLRWFLRMWTWVPVLAVAFVAAEYGMRACIYALTGHQLPHGPWATTFAYEISKFLLAYLLLSGVHFGFRMFDAWQRERAAQRPATDGNRGPASGRLSFSERGRTIVIDLDEIEWLQAADNYVSVHLDGRELLIRRTLTGLLGELGERFVRTHRGAAVRLDRIVEVRPRDKGDATIVMKSGAEVPCSRQYRAALIGRM